MTWIHDASAPLTMDSDPLPEMKTAHTSRFQKVVRITGEDDWDHDPWGTAMGMFFSVAEVLDMSDIEGDVTPDHFSRWQHRRGFAGTVPDLETVAARADDFSEGEFADDYSYATVELASALVNRELTQDDLIYAGNVLDRYTELLRKAGKDY